MEKIIELIAQYPQVAVVLAAIGTFRVIFKPIMEALDKIVISTETKKDDDLLNKVKENKIYKVIVFLVDYLSSIKLPQQK